MAKDTSPEAARRRRRSLLLAGTLAALVIIVYVLTIAKMGPEILNRPL